MSNRSIELTLKANVSSLTAGLKTAQTAASNAGRDLDQFRKNNEQAWNTIGTTAATGGAAMVAGVGLVVKSAMDWESAWAGVTKTVEGSDAQLASLEDGLRSMASELPATHQEIAAVAEAAGQLGVKTDDIESFTRTMIDLGETTNLTAEEAATSLAQFMNIMGTAGDDVDNLGSALVELGNNGASTEKDILMMSQRIAAVGTQMGMTEADVMGLASAMSSVGIEAEAGGTAISMTMKTIDADVRAGGDSLEQWAELAGVSAQEFAAAWENDAAGALTMVTTGLGEAGAAGDDMNGILANLGVTGIRETDTMLRLAQSGDLLAESFETGAEAFDSASALAEEAGKRYETTEAKISIAWNQIKDAAITAGEAILPVIGGIAESAGDLADWFSEIPAPVAGAVTALSGVAGVSALALGGLVLLVPKVVETADAFSRLNKQAPGASKALRGLGIAGAVAGGVTILGAALIEIVNASQPAAAGIEDVANALMRVNETGDFAAIDDMFTFNSVPDATFHIEGFADALDRLSPETLTEGMGNLGASMGFQNAVWQTQQALEAMDQTLSTMDAEEAADHMNRLRLEAEAGGNMDLSSWSELEKMFPEYTKGIEAAANATGASVEEVDLFQAAMGNLPPEMQRVKDAAEQAAKQDQLTGALEEVGLAADGTVDSLASYLDMLFETGLKEQTARESQRAYSESLAGMGDTIDQIIADHGGLSAALNDAGDDFSTTTEAGIAAGRAFDGLAESGMSAATAMAENGASQEEVQAAMQGTYEDLIAQAEQFGITGEAAEALAREVLGIPDDMSIETWMSETAKATAEETKAAVDSIPDQATIDAWMSDAAFLEALATRAAVLGIPEEDVVASFMSSAAKDEADETTAAVLGIPVGASVSSWMSSNARDEAMSTNAWLNRIDGRSTSSTHTHTTYNRLINETFGISNGYTPNVSLTRPGGYMGGKVGKDFGLPGYALGGRLPYTGLGRDQILGIGSNGVPTALVDDGEWVIRERQARKFNGVLDAINRDHPSVRHLAGYYDGGQIGREWSGSAVTPAAQVGQVSATVDAGVIAAAVAGAMSGWSPMVSIGGREFRGVMKETESNYGGR